MERMDKKGVMVMHRISIHGHDLESGTVLVEALVAFFLIIVWGVALLIISAQIWKLSYNLLVDYQESVEILKTL